MQAKVAERGQVVIPKAIRDKLGIKPGTILDIRAENGQLVAKKRFDSSPLDRLYGALADGRSTQTVLDDLRDPAES